MRICAFLRKRIMYLEIVNFMCELRSVRKFDLNLKGYIILEIAIHMFK